MTFDEWLLQSKIAASREVREVMREAWDAAQKETVCPHCGHWGLRCDICDHLTVEKI